MMSNSNKKTTIASIIYGVIGVITVGTGLALIIAKYNFVFGIIMIIAGITGFGLSCFSRSWLYGEEEPNSPLNETGNLQ